MCKGQLLGFVEEMGDQYKHLLEGTIDESHSKPGTQCATATITQTQSTTKDVDRRKSLIDNGDIVDSGQNNKDDKGDDEEWEIITATSQG